MKSRSLVPFKFDLLPLGVVKPRGWIRDQLELCASGLGGSIYNYHRFVKDSTWLGGDVEYSPLRESAPYWYNYIVPLAYLLDHDTLKQQANHFLDYVLKHQYVDGWLGPEDTKHTRGIWARCLVLMGLVNHAIADPTQYDRIVQAMLRFTTLVHSMLTDDYIGLIPQPGDEFDDFGLTRAHELSTSLQWLYEQVNDGREKRLIWETMDLAWEASRVGDRDWTKFFTDKAFPKQPSMPGATLIEHAVNVAEGLRYMPQLYRMTWDRELATHTGESVDMVFKYHGTTFGAIAGDEFLAGLHPKRGAELCATVELIASLSYLYRLLGENEFADRAELAAYNALPAGITADWWAHQYLTQTNQPWARELKDWPWYNCGGRSLVFGLEPNYPCCLVNHSAGLPKFAMNIFVASQDHRSILHQYLVAAEVVIPVKNERPVTIISETHYPFDERIHYTIRSDRKFDFYIRIPEWVGAGSTITKDTQYPAAREPLTMESPGLSKIVILPGHSTFSISLTTQIRVVSRPNNSVAIYRGALLFALEIPHQTKESSPQGEPEDVKYPPQVRDVEYTPTGDWQVAIDPSQTLFHREETEGHLANPIFASGAPPVSITVAASKISNWALEGDCAGLPPSNPAPVGKPFAVRLVPFASAKLHIADFPVLKLGYVDLENIETPSVY